MAYMSQEKKKAIAPVVKAILAKYHLKGSLSVEHHSVLRLTIKSGAINFTAHWLPACEFNYQVNEYHIDGYFSGIAAEALKELRAAMNEGNHDNSDIMTDYFDVGWYVNIHLGKWDKPYEFKP